MKTYLLLGIFCCLSLTIQGQNTWLGVNTNWNDGANWTAGIPTSASYVRINSGPSNFPVLTGNVTVHRCEMNGGTVSLGSYELKSDSSYILLSTINSTGGKFITTEAVRFGRNSISGAITLEIEKGYLYGNVFNNAMTLIANAPTGGSDAVIVGWIRPDTFKGETTFINKGPQNGIIVGVQADGGFDTTVFEQKFTFRNESTVANATSVFGNGEYSASSKVLFKGEVVLEGTHTGINQPLLSFINAEFRQPVTVKMRGGTIRFGVTQLYTRSVLFQSSLLLDTPGTTIEFGDGFTPARMNAASTISVESGQMTSGELRFYKYRSLTTTPQLIQLNGSGTDSSYATRILTTDSTDFAGAVYLRADRVQLDGGRFAAQTTVEQLGASSTGRAMGGIINSVTTLNAGGNRFLDSLIVINRRSGVWEWESSRQDTHGKGIGLTHAALGTGWTSWANTGVVTLPHLTVSSSASASTSGGIRIGYGADTVFLPANKQLITQNFSRGNFEFYHFFRRGSGLDQSLMLTDSSSLRIETALFESKLTVIAPHFILLSSIFSKTSTFIKTHGEPTSFVDETTFYDLVAFENQTPLGQVLFGTRDSQVIKFTTTGPDSLVRITSTLPTETAVDRHPNKIILQSGFEINANARYTALIASGEFMPSVVPPSPNAAQLGRFGEVPVSLANGILSYQIPLFEVVSGRLKVPVRLEYSGSGLKVNDMSSEVGTGWILKAGGAITRSVRGIPDDDTYGYLSHDYPQPILPLSDECYISAALLNRKDPQPDLWFYNFNEFSGTYLYSRPYDVNTNLYLTNQTPVPILYPHESTLKITNDGNTKEITDNEGTIYTFGVQEITTVNSISQWASTYYLSKIKNQLGDEIIFSYTENVSSYTESVYTRILRTKQTQPTTLTDISHEQTPNTTHYAQKQLSDIYFTNGKVHFSYADDRQDNPNAGRLVAIILYKKDGADSYLEVKKFVLEQDHFQCNEEASRADFNPSSFSHSSGSPLLKRLRLKSVEEIPVTAVAQNPKYSFEYYNDLDLPIHYSMSQDYWGYYNGATNSKNLLVWDTNSLNVLPNLSDGANRTPNVTYAVLGTLKSITYPTKGKSEFVYELNKGPDNQAAGGLRIKTINSFDIAGNKITEKSFNYTTPYYVSNVYSGDLNNLVLSNRLEYSIDPCECNVNNQRVTETIYNEEVGLVLGGSSSVAYEKVEEYNVDHTNPPARLGKTFYLFSQVQDYDARPIPNLSINNSWQRGMLLEKSYSRLTENLEICISKEINTYQSFALPFRASQLSVYQIFKFIPCSDPEVPICSQSNPLCENLTEGITLEDEYSADFLHQNAESILLVSSESQQISYDANGLNPVIVSSKKEYEYADYPYTQSNKITHTNSDGKVFDSKKKYPYHFATAPYTEMVTRHIIQPAIEATEEIANVQQYKIVTNYQKLVSGIFTVSSVQSQFKTADPLQTEITFTSYDGYGNPLSWNVKGLTTDLTYYADSDYGKTRLLKEKTVNSQTTFYDYEPLFGVKEIKQPNQLQTFFQYDGLGRLRNAKDHNSKITDHYSYVYVID